MLLVSPISPYTFFSKTHSGSVISAIELVPSISTEKSGERKLLFSNISFTCFFMIQSGGHSFSKHLFPHYSIDLHLFAMCFILHAVYFRQRRVSVWSRTNTAITRWPLSCVAWRSTRLSWKMGNMARWSEWRGRTTSHQPQTPWVTSTSHSVLSVVCLGKCLSWNSSLVT